ncbi:hypothetical protein AVEN_189145-1 [Araneus ventricosus]|uniref:Uncharacterized protein n=1 Tax=Araneus ventricosus TaxID=182803 RepID=A0A4Y2KMS0_ARAVE|nr:hypothetical protein AVEN_224586-1 [Araneus ventricosus]GBN02723.1 hypothetical protein AVEN_76401-1 [Araneus ventricosus]GBN02742.1 hypothetical protein AVEN_109683-1 [Araneus ventricosus]GBN02778.1 hypothetical protein AVEN_189145-1 [Araneus ventricosus]
MHTKFPAFVLRRRTKKKSSKKDVDGKHFKDMFKLHHLLNNIDNVVTRIKNMGKLEKERSKYRWPYAVWKNQLGLTWGSAYAVRENQFGLIWGKAYAVRENQLGLTWGSPYAVRENKLGLTWG